MRTPSIVALLLLSTAALARQVPPPVVASGEQSPPPRPSRTLVSWMPGEVSCDGAIVAGSPIRRPWGNMLWGFSDALKPVTLRFAIDATGRPISIERVGDDPRRWMEDAAPALAASQFRKNSPRRACTVTYSPSQQPLSAAPVEDLISYTITPMSGPLPKEGWDRIRQAGTCSDAPRPQPLVRAFPDFRALPSTPGVKDWALVAYDTDASGKATKLRIASGTGSAAMDAASMKAIRESRFTGGARTGCVYPYWRTPGTLAAPAMPGEASFRSAATCAGPRNWRTAPVLLFPEPYRRRRIEGWAVVSYDTAPWGQIGNVKVLAAQPSDDFGKQAAQVIQSARLEPMPQAMTGCIDRVRFVMGPEDMPPPENEPARPLY